MLASGSPPRVVVVPFGVPKESGGLGLGLAALVHGFLQVGGEGVALAQLMTRTNESVPEAPVGPIETFLPPQAWSDLSSRGEAPAGVHVVVTGVFEPPALGPGTITLLAFDPRDGSTRARVEAHVDEARAGEALRAAFDDFCRDLGGELGTLRDIEDLQWEALESVLRGERCLVHDAQRGGPYDRLAALVHLERAVEDAPAARFPAGRLAALAIDAVMNGRDERLADAAMRALRRAVDGAPHQLTLLETSAALRVRTGDRNGAEEDALAAIAIDPARPRPYGILSEARRSRADFEGALAAAERGLEMSPEDPVLLTERGVCLYRAGDLAGARDAFERALSAGPPFPGAFVSLAGIAVESKDAVCAQSLVDRALAWPIAHPDIARQAIVLAGQFEPEGVARCARTVALARKVLVHAPNDGWASLMLGRALAQMGERDPALAALRHAEACATGTHVAAEALRARLPLEAPELAVEVESVMRGANTADAAELPAVAARACRLADEHQLWIAHYALGVARRRMNEWPEARAAFERALELAPGSPDLELELVDASIALSEGDLALEHARKLRALAGDGPRTLGALARAELCRGEHQKAMVWALRALVHDPQDADNRRLEAELRALLESPSVVPAPPGPSEPPPPAGVFARLKARWFPRRG